MDRLDAATTPVDVLCGDIVDRYHAALHRSLPQIRGELAALCATGGSTALHTVQIAFDHLADLIEGHLAKEEHLLFPALEALATAEREGRRRPPMAFVALVHPIRLMEIEHLRIEAALDRVRDAVLEVAEPESLNPRWGRCLASLANLDRDLGEHHRAEGNILFPAALELEHRFLV